RQVSGNASEPAAGQTEPSRSGCWRSGRCSNPRPGSLKSLPMKQPVPALCSSRLHRRSTRLLAYPSYSACLVAIGILVAIADATELEAVEDESLGALANACQLAGGVAQFARGALLGTSHHEHRGDMLNDGQGVSHGQHWRRVQNDMVVSFLHIGKQLTESFAKEQ